MTSIKAAGEEPTTSAVPSFDYYGWLDRGRKLVAAFEDVQWQIGDWLVEGEVVFDEFSTASIPSYMKINQTLAVPNFWKDAASETGFAVSTLRSCAKVVHAFPDPKKRFKELTFRHHMLAAMARDYEKRYEYLKACLREGEKPRGVEWLDLYIMQCEGRETIVDLSDGLHPVRFFVPEEVQRKLKQLGKYHGKKIGDLVSAVCNEAVGAYLATEAEKVSLTKYGFYEGRWPFHEKTRTEKAQAKQTRRRVRAGCDPLQKDYHRKRGPRKTWQQLHDQGRRVAINRYSKNGRAA